MREILFRGKRIDSGEWVVGIPWIFAPPVNKAVIVYAMGLVGEDDDTSRYCECHEVDPSTIGQYTGLTDKSDKKIFEGDIVFYYCSDITAVVKYGQYVDYDSPNKPANGFYVEYQEDGKTIQESVDSRESDEEYGCEVIGNIYDNPELLEVTPDEYMEVNHED